MAFFNMESDLKYEVSGYEAKTSPEEYCDKVSAITEFCCKNVR
jgi:hypothetical protein